MKAREAKFPWIRAKLYIIVDLEMQQSTNELHLNCVSTHIFEKVFEVTNSNCLFQNTRTCDLFERQKISTFVFPFIVHVTVK